ncbi:MAG: hypothetical protein NE328_11250 [Lentisphaeraceae bacterium]|nr:hypothetical protein [Lentisphaeraceae bacterium]
MDLSVNLLVLRCNDIEKCREFYQKLGFIFQKEKHGKGPEHYASDNFGFVLELYPAKQAVIENTRIGFSTVFIPDLVGKIVHDPDVQILDHGKIIDNRIYTILKDPEGRVIECSQKLHTQ